VAAGYAVVGPMLAAYEAGNAPEGEKDIQLVFPE